MAKEQETVYRFDEEEKEAVWGDGSIIL